MSDRAPDHVEDLASACMASVRATVGVDLDLSADTLPILDHYAHEVLDVSAEDILQLTAPMCGAYFGEVLRRRFGGLRWHAPKDEPANWRLELEPAFLFFNPVGIAIEVITEADAPGWHAHLGLRPEDREEVERSVAVFGDTRESDYYSFAIRGEVIEQALEALGRLAAGRDPASFDAQAYAHHIERQKN
ncbi:MAG: hypothetical protein CMN30_27155 [Sandaracinus sp.]|nr:hypothetical protein [Sandaracinus sp.]|tara:strand:+ start:459 stop:1028 length:570 start_codon:yes stop_codon:yes gene_type:complete